MSVKRILLSVAVVVLVAAGSFAADQAAGGTNKVAEVKIVPQTTCPVMGGAIDKNRYVDYDGKRIYVCCNMCVKTVKADPVKYIKKLEAEGVTIETVKKTGDVEKNAAESK